AHRTDRPAVAPDRNRVAHVGTRRLASCEDYACENDETTTHALVGKQGPCQCTGAVRPREAFADAHRSQARAVITFARDGAGTVDVMVSAAVARGSVRRASR